jgi:hypothetical protein
MTVVAQITPALYGRETEQALMSELLNGARESPSGTLVLRGDPGVGKSALLRDARDGRAEAPPSVRERLIRQTGGNPLALLEVPAALTSAQLSGEEPLPEVLPMTRRLEGIFLERVRRLPAGAQRLLLIAAADDSEDVLLVARAARRIGAGTEALDAAEQAGLLSIVGARLEFRHRSSGRPCTRQPHRVSAAPLTERWLRSWMPNRVSPTGALGTWPPRCSSRTMWRSLRSRTRPRAPGNAPGTWRPLARSNGPPSFPPTL